MHDAKDDELVVANVDAVDDDIGQPRYDELVRPLFAPAVAQTRHRLQKPDSLENASAHQLSRMRTLARDLRADVSVVGQAARREPQP